MTDRTPSPLALRIAQDLLCGYVAHGLCIDEMIRNAALMVDNHLELDRREKETAALQLALRLNGGTKEGWIPENNGEAQ